MQTKPQCPRYDVWVIDVQTGVAHCFFSDQTGRQSAEAVESIEFHHSHNGITGQSVVMLPAGSPEPSANEVAA